MMILVTGSRDWTKYEVIRNAIADQIMEWKVPATDVLVIHGNAYGADKMAGIAGRTLGARVKPMSADWQRYKKRAGPIRNRKMLDLNPHVVLAFPLPESIGTVDCMEEAKRRGILVKVFKP